MSVLAWRGVAIEVRCDAPGLVAWLERFLCPPFARGGAPARRIDVRVGAPLPEGDAGPRVAALTLDEALPALRTARGYAVDDELGVAIRPTADGAELLVPRDGRLPRIGVMRVVRELAAAHALASGDVPLHAAGVVTAAGAQLFVGPKQAGKTTLLLSALARGGAALLANDRVFVDGDGVARGMPTIVAPRAPTLELFPDVAARLEAAPSPLGPGGLAAALGVRCAAEAPVARLSFVARGVAGFRVRPLEPAEARARLLETGLIAGGAQAGWLAPAVDVRPRVDALVARVPCAELIVGADALQSGEPWA